MFKKEVRDLGTELNYHLIPPPLRHVEGLSWVFRNVEGDHERTLQRQRVFFGPDRTTYLVNCRGRLIAGTLTSTESGPDQPGGLLTPVYSLGSVLIILVVGQLGSSLSS